MVGWAPVAAHSAPAAPSCPGFQRAAATILSGALHQTMGAFKQAPSAHSLPSAMLTSPSPALLQEALHAAGLPCDQFEELEGQARVAARQAAAAEERAAQLAEEAEMLRLELAARPTQSQYDSLKRQADIMERQLLAKSNADKAADGHQGRTSSDGTVLVKAGGGDAKA